MSEPNAARPVPGPPRAVDGPSPDVPAEEPPVPGGPGGDAFADLDRRPVSEHVAVYEAEHDRLQRELATIDQL